MSFVIDFSGLRFDFQTTFMTLIYNCLYTKTIRDNVGVFFLLEKEKGGSLTVGDFEIAAKYSE